MLDLPSCIVQQRAPTTRDTVVLSELRAVAGGETEEEKERTRLRLSGLTRGVGSIPILPYPTLPGSTLPYLPYPFSPGYGTG